MKLSLLTGLWVGLLLCVSACEWSLSETRLPYKAWELDFLAPQNMDVWVETADVEDVRGEVFVHAGSGTVSMAYSPSSSDWGIIVGSGGRRVVGAALPRRIYVRWQSLVEPQTYSVTLDIPEELRKQMLLQAPSMMRVPDAPHDPEYYNAIAIGLAPGGIVRVWVTGPGLQAIPMMCVKAQVEPKGPYDGESNGKYRPLTERPLPYLQAHPTPYGSWGC